MDAETTTYMIIAAAGGIGLGVYGYLILAPAWTAYGRNWERVTAAFLSLFVLAAFAGAGLAIGLVLVYYWEDLLDVFRGGAIHAGDVAALLRAAAGAP